MNPKEQLLRNTALRICLDWLNAPDYRRSASYEVVRSHSSLWKQILHERETSGTYHYEETMKLWAEALKFAVDRGWLERRFSKIGRPRTRYYSLDEQNHASYLLGNMNTAESTRRRLAAAANDWQEEAYSLITVSDKVFEELVKDCPLGNFEHVRRDELQALMGMSPRATGEFYRWLRDNGWGEKRVRQKNDLGEVVRVRVIYKQET